MAKRYNASKVSIHRTYRIEEAARAVGVHVQTIRAWIKNGLPCIRERRPFLILGAHLKAFIKMQNDAGRAPLEVDQLYCLKCRAGKVPAGCMADYIPTTGKRGRLSGICSSCETICNRFISIERITLLAPSLDVKYPAALDDLNDTNHPTQQTHK